MKFLVIVFLSFSLISCTSLKPRSAKPAPVRSAAANLDPYEMPAVETVEIGGEMREELAEELPVKSATDPIRHVPMVSNAHVDKWIEFFQGRGRDLMTRYLQRSSRYIPVMKEILKSHGLPEELVYIALIESGFTSRARSHAGAVGYWQFLRGTAKDFGLRVNSHVDERRDPILATHAAARYLNGVYHVFGNWYLAIASYNAGHNRMKGVVMRHHSRDFWDLVRGKKLPSETMNYVPKFLAAWKIGENPEQYGFDKLDYQPVMSFEEIVSAKPLSLSALAKHSRTDLSELRSLNPALRTDYVPVGRGNQAVVRVPAGRREVAAAALLKSYARPASSVATYRVRRGDTLGGIAQRHGTSLSALMRLNGLSRKSVLRVGQYLKVSGSSIASSEDSVASRNLPVPRSKTYYKRAEKPASRSRRGSTSTHVVRRGDNLTEISAKYGVSLNQLRQANGLRRGSTIRVGQRLKVPTKKVHRVSAGETLIGIANRYGISLSDLRKANRLSRQSKIYVGAHLRIPL